MDSLERDLYALAEWVEWPPTPVFSVGAGHGPPESRRQLNRWALAAAAALLAAALALTESPPIRDTVASWLGLRGVEVHRVQHLPTPTGLPPGPLGARLQLGDRLTLTDAERQAGFKVLLPSGQGQPDEVYFTRDRKMVSLLYSPRPGLPPATSDTGVSLLVSEFPGNLNTDSFMKVLQPGTNFERVDAGSGDAYFISGNPHLFVIYDGPRGTDESRLAGNVLIWQRPDGVLIRIEGGLSKEQAVTVARSLG